MTISLDTIRQESNMYADDKCCSCNLGSSECSNTGKTLKALVDEEKKRKSAFDRVLDARIVKTKEILSVKEKEYASNDDRFHNFKVAARIGNCTPEQALYGMMLKHEVSVQDMVEWTESNPERITRELIDSKIGDCVNYLILLEGLLLERIDKNEHKTNITAGLE